MILGHDTDWQHPRLLSNILILLNRYKQHFSWNEDHISHKPTAFSPEDSVTSPLQRSGERGSSVCDLKVTMKP